MNQDTRKIEDLITILRQYRDQNPHSVESRRAEYSTIEEISKAGVRCSESSDLLWTEDPSGNVLSFVHYKTPEGTPRAALFRVEKQELVRLAESVLHYLGTPIHQQILEELRALRQELKQRSSD